MYALNDQAIKVMKLKIFDIKSVNNIVLDNCIQFLPLQNNRQFNKIIIWNILSYVI